MKSRFLSLFKKKKKEEVENPTLNFKQAIKTKKEKLKVTTIENQNRKVKYTQKAKEIIRNTPGLLREIKDYLHGQKYRPRVYTVYLDNEKTKLIIQEISRPSRNGMITDNYYTVEITNKKEKLKFFVKRKKLRNYHLNSDGTREMKALEIIKSAGFNVIEPYFSWNTKGKESFIFYEYQSKMVDVEKAYLQGKINEKDITYLRKKLQRTETKINDYIKKRYPNKTFKINDIAPNSSKENHALHLFINFETKKLYLFDPILTEKT